MLKKTRTDILDFHNPINDRKAVNPPSRFSPLSRNIPISQFIIINSGSPPATMKTFADFASPQIL
jgi:hypothetical protein